VIVKSELIAREIEHEVDVPSFGLGRVTLGSQHRTIE
jgi:hypothetical protein